MSSVAQAAFLSPCPLVARNAAHSQHPSSVSAATCNREGIVMKISPTSKPRAARPWSTMPKDGAKSGYKRNAKAGPKDGRKDSPTSARNPAKRTPTFRKLQEKRNAGPRAFREKSTREAQQAERLAAMERACEEKDTLVRAEMRKRRRERASELIKLSDIKVGTEMRGIVHNVVRHGAFVDIGATRDGLVHVRDMSVTFVSEPANLVRTGDEVTVWIKYVNPVSNTLALSMRRPLGAPAEKVRSPVSDVQVGERVEGTVARITNFGAYIDIGAERLAFLHVNSLWGRRPRDTLGELILGRPIWVIVADVDEVRSFIRLNARGRRSEPLDSQGRVVEERHSSPEFIPRSVVLARPGREFDEDAGDTRALGSAERAMLLVKEKARDDLLMEKIGPDAQTETWDEIRDMFDDRTQFVDMNSEDESEDELSVGEDNSVE